MCGFLDGSEFAHSVECFDVDLADTDELDRRKVVELDLHGKCHIEVLYLQQYFASPQKVDILKQGFDLSWILDIVSGSSQSWTSVYCAKRRVAISA